MITESGAPAGGYGAIAVEHRALAATNPGSGHRSGSWVASGRLSSREWVQNSAHHPGGCAWSPSHSVGRPV